MTPTPRSIERIVLKLHVAELNCSAARQSPTEEPSDSDSLGPWISTLLEAVETGGIRVVEPKKPNFSAAVQQATEKGLLRVLANPTLQTTSGHEVRFSTGGEFAVPSVRPDDKSASTAAAMFRPFGFSLTCLPGPSSANLLSLQVDLELSHLDRTLDVVGIPGLTTRTLTTNLAMHDGQTFVSAWRMPLDVDTTTASPLKDIALHFGKTKTTWKDAGLVVAITVDKEFHPISNASVPYFPSDPNP